MVEARILSMLECLTHVLCTYATAIVEDSLNRKPQDIKKNESWYVAKLPLPLNLAPKYKLQV